MGKIGFIFPGQGAQKHNMGRDFYESYPLYRDTFHKGEDVLNTSFKDIIWEHNEKLNETRYTQPAMVLNAIGILYILKEYNLKPDITAGLSLGEYSSLYCGEYIDFSQVMKLINIRAQLMDQCAKKHKGAMAAIIGIKKDQALALCDEGKKKGTISVANYNCPGQIVIAGEEQAIQWAIDNVKAFGGIKAIKLNVSGAFHSQFMSEASSGLEREFLNVSLTQGTVPIALNYDGKIYKDLNRIKNNLILGVKSPVHFHQCIEAMKNFGVDTFIEIGPGKTLTSFIKKIDRNLKTFNIEDIKTLEITLDALIGR